MCSCAALRSRLGCLLASCHGRSGRSTTQQPGWTPWHWGEEKSGGTGLQYRKGKSFFPQVSLLGVRQCQCPAASPAQLLGLQSSSSPASVQGAEPVRVAVSCLCVPGSNPQHPRQESHLGNCFHRQSSSAAQPVLLLESSAHLLGEYHSAVEQLLFSSRRVLVVGQRRKNLLSPRDRASNKNLLLIKCFEVLSCRCNLLLELSSCSVFN